MSKKGLIKKMAEVYAKELQGSKHWMYLSFADDSHGGFQGGVVIFVFGITDAILLLKRKGIDLHGEVLGVDIPDTMIPPKEFRNRILTAQDVANAWKQDAVNLKGKVKAVATS